MKFNILFFLFTLHLALFAQTSEQKIVYISTDIRIPFWDIMARGAKEKADTLGYDFEILSADNSVKKELELTVKAIKEKVDGIIVSPSTSSACVTLLKLAKNANIPVVISDIGSDGGEYVSYISSNNKEGAYAIGKVLAQKLHEKGWSDGKVGIIAIPQKRLNGQARTAGFIRALSEYQIKGGDIKQIQDWSDEETYRYTQELIDTTPNLRAIWLQTSNIYKGALQAIRERNKESEILLIAFDAEPEFIELIQNGTIVGSAMQQPYLMGEVAMRTLDAHIKGEKVTKSIQLPILPISTSNIKSMLPKIQRDVLGTH